ncbi:MAG: hypothetical protein N3F64_03435 [Nitrososphaeria archaeon]|nr:hypothetical protein [Nitrososphaeria archaeon]
MKKRIFVNNIKAREIETKIRLFETAELFGLKGIYIKDAESGIEAFVEGDVLNIKNFLSYIGNIHNLSPVKTEDYYGNVMSIEGFYRILVLEQLNKLLKLFEQKE